MDLDVIRLDNGIKQINLIGRLDIQGAGEIETPFVSQSSSGEALVLLDMSGVIFIASTGMRILLSNAKSLTERGGKMVLYNPTPVVRDVLETIGIAQLIPVYDDFETACAALLSATASD